jgi:5'-3' exonuclease
MQVALVDSGFFIGRRGRHWGPRGALTRMNRQLQNGKRSYKQFFNLQRKLIINDMKYLEFRMRSVKYMPSAKSPIHICWDGTKGRNERGKLNNQYKANRAVVDGIYDASTYTIFDYREYLRGLEFNPDDLRRNWISYYDENLEADDMIAIKLQEFIQNPDYESIWIFSSDSDTHQFFAWDERIRIHNFVEEMPRTKITEDCGIPLTHYVDFKSIVGDTSDNIKGIPNIGPKKAAEWITNHGGLTDIPIRNFRFCETIDSPKISEHILAWRKRNERSQSSCIQEFGSWWRDLEKEKHRTIGRKEYDMLMEHIPTIGNCFRQHDYENTVRQNYRIIKLPFQNA